MSEQIYTKLVSVGETDLTAEQAKERGFVVKKDAGGKPQVFREIQTSDRAEEIKAGLGLPESVAPFLPQT